MPWVTPTLESLRTLNRDNVQSQLRSGPMVPNSVMRVMSDANAGLGYLTLLYIDWLSKQLLPDTAETQWLDRHAAIWLPNGGRKAATFANGVINFTGSTGTAVPQGTLLTANIGSSTGTFQTTNAINIGTGATPANFVALTSGQTNLVTGSALSLQTGIPGVDGSATIASISDGIDGESDDDLRARVLFRIQNPPMGGDAADFVAWATEVAGVTRAWCSPNEMGPGTVTVRFMMDNLRAAQGGFPNTTDVATVAAYIDSKRPVCIKDRFVLAPVARPINLTIENLDQDNTAVREAISLSVANMLNARAAPAHSINGVMQPAQTIYAAWVTEAIMEATGVNSFTLIMNDTPMVYAGNLATLGTINYV
jgi:uncharacterized phage protein gp47/JayE